MTEFSDFSANNPETEDDEFLVELKTILAEKPVRRKQEAFLTSDLEEEEETEQEPEAKPAPMEKKQGKAAVFLRGLTKIALILLETVLLLAVTLYGVMFILAKGPSPTARNLFVRSVRETSAIGFLANLYLSEEEIAQIESANQIPEYQETDTSLITITTPDENTSDGPVADQWGLVDEDGDGLILEEIRGEGYRGYMLVVLDPSRVIMGSVPESYGGQGYTVEQMVKHFDAVAGTNAGGFHDPDGTGNGSIPDTMTVYEGEVYYQHLGIGTGFVGLDSNHILHVGNFTAEDVRKNDIQYGVSFGPVLISNGEIALAENNVGGLNPRTAIGQRSDGAILMLVIDGRQAISIGATYMDLCEIFLEYGAVNACNLDGGSSTMMWVGDQYVNNCASVIGVRPVPTTFLVLKEGVNSDG